jgi:hypothetical protein
VALLALIFFFGVSLFNYGSVQPGSSGGESPTYRVESSQGRASLGVKSLRPLVVVGHGFKARERVRVSGAGTRTVTATRGGVFTVRMGQYRCAGFTLVARGSAGSRASVNFSNVSNVHCLD